MVENWYIIQNPRTNSLYPFQKECALLLVEKYTKVQTIETIRISITDDFILLVHTFTLLIENRYENNDFLPQNSSEMVHAELFTTFISRIHRQQYNLYKHIQF